LTWSCAVALGGGEVKRKILIVRSSLAVAKYLLAGSKVMPLTWDWCWDSVFSFSKLWPDHTTIFESRPTVTRMEESHDQPRSWTSLSWPIRRRKTRQFSTGGGSFEPAGPREPDAQATSYYMAYRMYARAPEGWGQGHRRRQSCHPRPTQGTCCCRRTGLYESFLSVCLWQRAASALCS
jgi:hypothetical protein